jgi:hypothetical protein
MFEHRRTLWLLVPAVSFLLSCDGRLLIGRPDEGVIEYALSFPDYDPNGLMAGMLPERITITFSEGRQLAELSAGMGIFRTAVITDDAAQELDYHMSLMGKRIKAHMHPSDLETVRAENGRAIILHTPDVDTIAGYPCRKAIAIFNRIDRREVDLWYTDRIDMQRPNWFGPYGELPGVLLRYEVVQHGMRMRLEAIKVSTEPVDPGVFSVRTDYEQVAPEVLHHELSEVLGTFTM